MTDLRKNLEESVLQNALIEIADMASTLHPSYAALSHIADHAQNALEVVRRSRERALIEEAKSGGPVMPLPPRPRKPRNVIPFDPHFRRKHKDRSL